jgi:hypothetical protein
MKLKIGLPIIGLFLVGLMGSCSNQLDGGSMASKGSTKENSTSLSSVQNQVKSSQTLLKPVDLGVAGNFVILSKTGITDVYKSSVTGDVGSSPISGAAILLSCAEVTGTIYTVDAAGPLPSSVKSPSMLTTAISDMQTAYVDAAGRVKPDFLNLGAGNIGSKTLTPGLYKWTSALVIPTDITIAGGPIDIFIFQVAGTLKMSSAVKITLTGGAQAKNIFWQTSGAVTLGTTSHFEGNILSMTGINMQTGASLNGRMLAQTAVTLEMNTVNKPQ